MLLCHYYYLYSFNRAALCNLDKPIEIEDQNKNQHQHHQQQLHVNKQNNSQNKEKSVEIKTANDIDILTQRRIVPRYSYLLHCLY